MYLLGVIGAGNIAGAIVTSAMKKNVVKPPQIAMSDINQEVLNSFAALGCFACVDNRYVTKESDIILLAVKPQVIMDVLDEIAPFAEGKTVVSIAAGISINTISTALGPNCGVIRAMPNTPILQGKGMTVLTRGKNVSLDTFDIVTSLFQAGGFVEFLDEGLMDAVTAVSGSGPAYFYRMANVMIKNAVEMGIPEKTALRLAGATMDGAAAMLLYSGFSPDELAAHVSSPGGATVAALTGLDELGFDEAVGEAMIRSATRSHELGLGK